MAPRGSQKKITGKPIFRDCVIARAGDLGKSDWPDEQIDKWISIHGGTYLRCLDQLRLGNTQNNNDDDSPDHDGSSNSSSSKITHVLATTELYAKMSRLRRKKFFDDNVLVVTCDWLEESINKKRRLREKEFRLDLVWQEEKRKKDERARLKERAERGRMEVEKGGVNTNLNHVYMDETCFSYDVVLMHTSKDTGMVSEKWRLRLYESNGKPHLYHCTATFNKTRGRAMVVRPSGFETPGKLAREFTAFKEFFYKKTGILWRDRMASVEGFSNDEVKDRKRHKFEYTPPTGGKPVGIMETEVEDTAYRVEADRKAAEHNAWRALLKRDVDNGKRCEREAEQNAGNAQHWLMEDAKHEKRELDQTKVNAHEEVPRKVKKFKHQHMGVDEQESPGTQKDHCYDPALLAMLARQDGLAPGVRSPHMAVSEEDGDESQHAGSVGDGAHQSGYDSLGSSPQSAAEQEHSQQDGCWDSHWTNRKGGNPEIQQDTDNLQDNEPYHKSHISDNSRLHADFDIQPDDNHQRHLDKDGDVVMGADISTESNINMETSTPDHEEEHFDEEKGNAMDHIGIEGESVQRDDDIQEDNEDDFLNTQNIEHSPHPMTPTKVSQPAYCHHSVTQDHLDKEDETVDLGHGHDDDVDDSDAEEQVRHPTTSSKTSYATRTSDHGDSETSRDAARAQNEVADVEDLDGEADFEPRALGEQPDTTQDHNHSHEACISHEQDVIIQPQEEEDMAVAPEPWPATSPDAPRLPQHNVAQPSHNLPSARPEANDLEAPDEDNTQCPRPSPVPPSVPPPPPPPPVSAHHLDHPRKVRALDEEIMDSQDQGGGVTQFNTQLDHVPRTAEAAEYHEERQRPFPAPPHREVSSVDDDWHA